jgi:hypothetical protein
LVIVTTSGRGSSLTQATPQDAAGAIQHRDGEAAEELRVGRHGSIGERPDEPWRVEQSIDEPRQAAEQRRPMLQVDADPAEQDVRAGDVGFVGP